ncbi:S53 family peptidase [Ralstonia sp. 1138]|uniref:S53 family peptidase n=1 Tax=Ralstonia sp. 1138 TaxID=3156423 RepID=UPI003390CB11
MRLLLSFFSLVVAIVLSACGGGEDSSTTAAPVIAPLLADRQIFESGELHGGAATLYFRLPYGGGPMMSGADYVYANSSGGLLASPGSAGPQIETPTLKALVSGFALPSNTPGSTRYLASGSILVRSPSANRRVSYTAAGIQFELLADDGVSVVQTTVQKSFSQTALSGDLSAAPAELLAQYPLDYWQNGNNLKAGAQWEPGAAYIKRAATNIGDTYMVQNCFVSKAKTAATAGDQPTPCYSGKTLTSDGVFPINLYQPGDNWPYEHDEQGDGTFTHISGVNMWIANAPLPLQNSPTEARRIYFELNGNIYIGVLISDGTPLNVRQTDGSVVSYSITLNSQAVSSIQNALVGNPAVAGSKAGAIRSAANTVDLFGIGGHGINGMLSPTDLRQHYNIPAWLDGMGQTIAIINEPSAAAFLDDINTFSQQYNLPQMALCDATHASACLRIVCTSSATTGDDCPTGSTIAGGGSGAGSEATLDIQMAHAIAPKATLVLVLASGTSPAHFFDAVDFASNKLDAVPAAISMSYGFNLSTTTRPSTAVLDGKLRGYVTQGIALFASSGDAGNYGGRIYCSPTSTTCVHYPAVSPFVTAVGGTRITSVSASGASGEQAWQFTGGGIGLAPMPSWQSTYLSGSNDAAVITANNGMRASPDVAAVADYAHSAIAIYRAQRWGAGGGTSAATPIWAGISALLAQSMASNGGNSLAIRIQNAADGGGFASLLYGAATGSSLPSLLNITVGNNNLTGNGACAICASLGGYSDLTGLGVPNVMRLLGNL